MRRICCVALILALLFGGIAQSQPVFAESKDDDVPTLCMVHYMEPNGIEPYDQKLRALFRRFTDETGIRISIKTMSWDQLDEMLLVSSQFNEPLGDLFMLSSQKLEYLVNGGALMPLDDFFDATFQRDEFLPYALEAGTSFFDGRLYLMLQSLHCRGLWYNRKYVAEPPETLDEVLNLSLALMQEHEDLYGLGFWGGSHYGAVEATLNTRKRQE